MTWQDAYTAGAFIAGFAAGQVAAIRTTRLVLNYLGDTRPLPHEAPYNEG